MKTQRTLPLAWMSLALLNLAVWPASAATRHWTGSAGTNWTTAANWSNNVAPAAGDTLIFPSGAATNWLTIGIAPADGAGLFQFLDSNAPQHPKRFYRAVSP